MRNALVCLLAFAACGRAPDATIESVTRVIPAAGIGKIVVIAKDAAVDLRTGDTQHLTVVTPAGVDAEVLDDALRIAHGVGTLRITAPAGLDVVARVDAGSLDLSGRWGKVTLMALEGDVRATVDALAGGKLTAQTGNVEFTARSAPAGSVTVTAPVGRISLTISSQYRGLLQLAAAAIDTPVDERVAVRRSPGNATVFVGKGFTAKDHEERPVHQRPAIWASGASVQLSLAD